MKRFKRCVIYVGVLTTMVASCVPQTQSALPSATPYPLATKTNLPIPTPTASIFPTSIFWTTPYPTPIRITKDKQIQFYELLKDNGGCDLPCFWGIELGTTSWEDAKTALEPFAAYVVGVPMPPFPSSVHILTNYEVELNTNTEIYVDDNEIVQYIDFDSGMIIKNRSTETHDRHLSWYSISETFRRYGIPDSIYLYYGTLYHETLGYSIQIVYEKLKFAVDYGGAIDSPINGIYITCPNWGDGNISSMELAVANPSDSIDVKTLIGYPFWEGVPPFEEASGMSVNEFYELMTSDKQPACFQGKQP